MFEKPMIADPDHPRILRMVDTRRPYAPYRPSYYVVAALMIPTGICVAQGAPHEMAGNPTVAGKALNMPPSYPAIEAPKDPYKGKCAPSYNPQAVWRGPCGA
jgi:hypothetical protein